MKNFSSIYRYQTQLCVLLLSTVTAGCNSGHWDTAGGVTPVPPAIITMMPINNSQKVALNYASTVSFSEEMDPATINSTTFTMVGPNNVPVAGTVAYTSDGNAATFTPTENLLPSTAYTLTISTGAKDLDGLAMTEAQVWTFTTGLAPDKTAPKITSILPVELAMNVCANRPVVIHFSEPINPLTLVTPANTITVVKKSGLMNVNGSVTLDNTGMIATFISTDLTPFTEYNVKVGTGTQDLGGNALAQDREWMFTTGEVCQKAIAMTSTATYGVLSNTAVTLGGGPNSVTGFRVIGNVGVFPGALTNCIGCDATTVNGVINIGNAAASDALTDLTVIYNDAVSRNQNVCTLIDSGSLATNPSAACNGGANGIFYPGLYWSASSIIIPAHSTITLDAKNDADAVFIFQSESTIDTSGGDTHIILANKANAKNVFWLAKSSATIGGTTSHFIGTVIAQSAINVNTGTQMTGRALARTAAVTVQDGATITVPAL